MGAPAGFAYVAEPALAMQHNPVSPFYEKERCFAYVAEPALAMQCNAVPYHQPLLQKKKMGMMDAPACFAYVAKPLLAMQRNAVQYILPVLPKEMGVIDAGWSS